MAVWDRAGMATATAGTGTVTLGSAIAAGTPIFSAGYDTFANAGAVDGFTVSYLILDTNGNWEYGRGTYTTAGTTLSRTPIRSSSGTSAITLSGNAQVFISLLKEDLREILLSSRTYYVRTDLGAATITIASPGVVTLNSHGLSNNDQVVLTISPKAAAATVTIASPAVVTRVAHGFASGQPIKFSTTGALPTGITAGTTYFVIAAGLAADTFEFSATVGGSAVNTSGSQSGTHWVERTGALPTGLTLGTVYFARNVTTNTFELSLTSGGASINTSGTQSGIFNAATGNDVNTGLAQTRAGAFLTMQAAINATLLLDLHNNNVTIQLADSTYTDGVLMASAQVGAGAITLQGNSTFPSNVLLFRTSVDCIAINAPGAELTVKDFKVQTTTSGYGLNAGAGTYMQFTNIIFGACANDHLTASAAGTLQANGNYFITGGANRHWNSNAAQLFIGGETILIFGVPAFSVAFGAVINAGLLQAWSNTFTGTATGSRYSADSNGVIQTFGASPTAYPGNSVGTVINGAQYL